MASKCPPMPSVRFQRAACQRCGATTEREAETKCQPTSDETGECDCGTDFDNDGFALSPTPASLQAMDDWISVHQGCDADGCVAMTVRDVNDGLGQVLADALRERDITGAADGQ